MLLNREKSGKNNSSAHFVEVHDTDLGVKDYYCMDNMNLIEFITRDEDTYFDRKSSRIAPKDVIKPVIAFANAGGGTLVLGIEDSRQIRGFKQSKSPYNANDYKAYILQHCSPNPRFQISSMSIDNNDYILVINVEASPNSVVRSMPDEKVYLRSNDKSLLLTHSQITTLEYDKGQRSFEDQIIQDATIDDIDNNLIKEYVDKMRITSGQSVQDILKARGLLRRDKPTIAALLLFGKNPTQFIPQARIRFIRYDGRKKETGERINIIKEETFDDPIPTALRKITKLIQSQLREFQFLSKDGIFQTIPEYPEFAWFEGIVNAFTHRDYRIYGDHIRVTMFDDRLEIKSPGVLPNIVTLANMKHTRFSRNPKIARVMSEFGWVKELNEGVNRIYDEMKRFFLDEPSYSEPGNNSVLLVLKNNIIARNMRDVNRLQSKVSIPIWGSLSPDEQTLLRYIYSKGSVTTKNAAAYIGKSVMTARKILRNLEHLNLLQWVGSSKNDPNQYFKIK